MAAGTKNDLEMGLSSDHPVSISYHEGLQGSPSATCSHCLVSPPLPP